MENLSFKLISSTDYQQLREALTKNPSLANKGVPLDDNPAKGHPLHRICDGVFAGKITDEQAIEIAKILLEFGADIDGFKSQNDNNTPLIAAASLNAEQLGLFYIDKDADIYYTPKSDGGTALHWACYCGKDKLVAKLIDKGAKLNQLDTSFQSTPIGWAIHPLFAGGKHNINNQLQCVKLLLKAGADQSLVDSRSMDYLRSVAEEDNDLAGLLK